MLVGEKEDIDRERRGLHDFDIYIPRDGCAIDTNQFPGKTPDGMFAECKKLAGYVPLATRRSIRGKVGGADLPMQKNFFFLIYNLALHPGEGEPITRTRAAISYVPVPAKNLP